MRRLLFGLMLVVSGCSRVPTDVGVVEDLNSTSILVSADDGHGTGFVVSDRYAVTCFHVAGPKGSIVMLDFDDGSHFDGVVVSESKTFDISVIHMSRTRANHVRFRLDPPAKGETIHYVGNPFGFYFLAAKGSVSGYSIADPRRGGIGMLLTNASFMPGYSGSALGDDNGDIVGMVDAVFFSQKYKLLPIGFAVPSERIMWLLKVNKIPYESN